MTSFFPALIILFIYLVLVLWLRTQELYKITIETELMCFIIGIRVKFAFIHYSMYSIGYRLYLSFNHPPKNLPFILIFRLDLSRLLLIIAWWLCNNVCFWFHLCHVQFTHLLKIQWETNWVRGKEVFSLNVYKYFI